MAAPSALHALRAFGVQVASDTAEYEQLRGYGCAGYLTDATSNPSLVYAAVCKAEYAHLVDDAVAYARARGGGDARLAMDRLVALVSAEIARIVPGRVSVSADPRLAHDTPALIAAAHALVAQLAALGVPRHRVLIKIPATHAGIRAARHLERAQDEAIHTNMTLVFGRVQAAACAEAGVRVISPFIGRVKDFYDARNPGPLAPAPLAKHPGIQLVQSIRASFAARGVKTEILAAGFRAPEEVIELCACGPAAGPDAVTIPPSLIAPLLATQQREPRRALPPLTDEPAEEEAQYFGPGGAQAYARDIAQEEIAAVKVPEGLGKFSADAQAMEDMLQRRLEL
ncbi:Transaldolase [Mycena indigotica]|uniref:Transaldolase n=1 Tax=Mycena indigotica TaxID=2126181 RepID=A0A8H6VS98_9AGAR|nr:Transaldolase [Mycena indigotica]KAF7291944.1 Transaldolase [Mycena indigotica]